MTFAVVDTAPEFRHLIAAPNPPQIIIVFAQVADALRPNTAAPQIAIGGDLATGPTGVTGNHLPLLI